MFENFESLNFRMKNFQKMTDNIILAYNNSQKTIMVSFDVSHIKDETYQFSIRSHPIL